MITIKEIAKLLDVSPGTVSKALNDKKDIGDDLKQKIKKKARELGYKPNPIAYRLSTQRSYTIGVFILSANYIRLTENFGFQFMEGIFDEASRYHFDLLLFTITSRNSPKRSYIELCQERRIEGAIIIGLALNDPYIESISASGIPVVVIDQHVQGKNVYFATSDNEYGIKLALDFLLSKGHQQIAYISAGTLSEVSNIRLNAYINYMQSKKLYQPRLIFQGDYKKESGYRIGKKIAGLKNKPSAIFAANDLMAVYAMQALKEKGLAIPGQISIIGFDNFMISEFSEPKLTTISQDADKIGRQAFQFIIKHINEQQSNKIIKVKPQLLVRDSVAIFQA